MRISDQIAPLQKFAGLPSSLASSIASPHFGLADFLQTEMKFDSYCSGDNFDYSAKICCVSKQH